MRQTAYLLQILTLISILSCGLVLGQVLSVAELSSGQSVSADQTAIAGSLG